MGQKESVSPTLFENVAGDGDADIWAKGPAISNALYTGTSLGDHAWGPYLETILGDHT